MMSDVPAIEIPSSTTCAIYTELYSYHSNIHIFNVKILYFYHAYYSTKEYIKTQVCLVCTFLYKVFAMNT